MVVHRPGGASDPSDDTARMKRPLADSTEGKDIVAGSEATEDDDSSMQSDPLERTDVDATFAAMVSQLGDLRGAPGGPPPDPVIPTTPPARHAVTGRAVGPRDWPTTPEVEALEEAESHFTPPDPALWSGRRDPLATGALIGAIGIPLLGLVCLVLRSVLTAWPVPFVVGPILAVVWLGCIGVLVWRMPHRRDHDDDGAVV